MQKRLLSKTATALLVAVMVLTGCKKDKDPVKVSGVSLNKTTLELTEGGSETLTATVTPADAANKAVTWSSSDAAVATVDQSGKVTAVKAGTVTITVTTTDGGKTATCAVTVTAAKTDPVTVAVTGVSLDKPTLTLLVGATETLKATVAPDNADNKAVTWSSSDAAVASVDAEGKVTAVKAGTATITVTTNDGGKTATCVVTVNAATVSVSGVSLDKPTLTLLVGASETLTATVAPDNADNKAVTWAVTEGDAATVDQSGKVTIDWGDGSDPETVTLTTIANTFTHTFADATPHDIAIDGQNITLLGIDDHMQVTALDVSNNPALTTLNCFTNRLTSLDVSNNTALTIVNCSGNNLERPKR